MSNKIPLVLAITGTRGVGKDTLFTILQKLEPRFKRYAFADLLKADLTNFLLQQFDIDPTTATGSAKELIRPMLIAYGCAKRELDSNYWVNRTIMQIKSDWNGKTKDFFPLITDVRFPNEAELMLSTFNDSFYLVNITRDGAPPPTDEEQKHFRKVAAMADCTINWGNNTLKEQEDIVISLLDRLQV